MLRKIVSVAAVCMLLFPPLVSSYDGGIPLKLRLRIDDVNIENGKVKTDEKFNVNVTVINKRLCMARGEIHIYLTCAGIFQKEIGKNDSVCLPGCISKIKEINMTIPCIIDEEDVKWYQEAYDIRVVLYEKRRGFLIERDFYTLEGIYVLSKFWEKDKVKITDFEVPEEWRRKEYLSITTKEVLGEIINVTVKNDGIYQVNVTVRVDLVEKPSIGIPLVDGIGEIRKEIGRGNETIRPGNDTLIKIPCKLRESEWDKREINVQAVLLVDVDGVLYEVDESTMQGVYIPREGWDEIKWCAFWIWILFIAATGTILLVLFVLQILWPSMKLTRKEVKEKVKEMEEIDERGKKKE